MKNRRTVIENVIKKHKDYLFRRNDNAVYVGACFPDPFSKNLERCISSRIMDRLLFLKKQLSGRHKKDRDLWNDNNWDKP